MRVICQTIDEFLENLRAEGPDAVWQKVIYISRIHRPLDGTKRDAVRFGVVLQAAAVVNKSDDEQYVLEVGEDCGIDYHDASQSMEGTVWAGKLYEKIRRFCEESGLQIRPGVLGE